MTQIFETIALTEPQTITRRDGTSVIKQQITLRELGGEHQDTFLATYLGDTPLLFQPGRLVAASLRFQVRTTPLLPAASSPQRVEDPASLSPSSPLKGGLGGAFQDIYLRGIRLIGFTVETPASPSMRGPGGVPLPGLPAPF